MKDILLSVIIPVFNTREYLTKCIRSIQSQSYENFEIIIVDDGSCDGSAEICDDLAKADERIRVIHKDNEGQLNARKTGASYASGEFITCVDSDDWIDANRFQVAMRAIIELGVDAVQLGGFVKEYENSATVVCGEQLEHIYDKHGIETDYMRLLAGDELFFDRKVFLGHWMMFIRRSIYKECIEQIDGRIRRAEDTLSILNCVLHCDSLFYIPDASYHYLQQREGSVGQRTTNWGYEHAYYYYRQLSIIESQQECITDEMRNVFIQFAYHNMFLTNYRLLYTYYKDYLFPYNCVQDGSRVIVYGAGNVGVELVNAINMDSRFELIAWIDAKPVQNPRSEFSVEPIKVIDNLKYDYIIISIIMPSIALAAKNDLINKGVDEKKIALMTCKDMRGSDLEEIFAEHDI